MRQYLAVLIAFSLSASLFAQTTVQMSAVKANNFGVSYSLPKTTLKIKVTYTKTTRNVGELYQYAERYLNISNPIVENSISYNLDKIDATSMGIVDKSQSYLLEFNNKALTAFITLTKDGLICAVNDDYAFPPIIKAEELTPVKNSGLKVDAKTYLSEEILRAGSTAKQAELIAKQIYRLRESRTNILTGDSDNMPPDGDAYRLVMNQLDEQEKALTAMFVGSESSEVFSNEFDLEPTKENIESEILFRFSNLLGVVDYDDLAGAPVVLSLQNLEPKTELILTEKEQKEMEKKFSQGIIYNLPSRASLNISFKGKKYVDKELEVVQFGSQDVLVQKMFEVNKQPVKVIFYPELGSIKQIAQ